jgi:hypothetical protein
MELPGGWGWDLYYYVVFILNILGGGTVMGPHAHQQMSTQTNNITVKSRPTLPCQHNATRNVMPTIAKEIFYEH